MEATGKQNNKHYQDLINYLEAVSTDICKAKELLTGEDIPFADITVKKDRLWESLVTVQDSDALAVSLLMQMCAGTCNALKQKVKDHIEGGQYNDIGDRERTKLNSVIPHNKLPEWVFGYLEWMLKHRPNATRLANEAHIVFNVNKTSEWLQKKSDNEIMKLLRWSKSALSKLKVQENERLRDLHEQLERISREKEERARAKIEKVRLEKQTLTSAILEDGLWKSREEVQLKLAKCLKHIQMDKLKKQIKFRQKVLEQPGNKKLFSLTKYEGRIVTVEQLKENLYRLIETEDNTRQEVNMTEE